MKRFRSANAVFLIALLLFSTILPTQLTFAADINSGNHEIDYNEKVPAEVAVPVQVAPELTITGEEGEIFSGGNIKFDIAEGSDPSERLVLPDGIYNVDGQDITVENGTIFIGSDVIGEVNDTSNGEGKSLQIDFSTIPIPNGDFEEGDTGKIIPNWTINNSSIGPDGNNVEQIWLGDLATKTQDRSYRSVGSNGDGTYTVTGPDSEYSYVTDVNYRTETTSTGDSPSVEGFEAIFNGWTTGQGKTGYVGEVYNDNDLSKGKALEVGFLWAHLVAGDYNKKDGKIASSFGVEAISDPFVAHKGDQLGFDWKANAGGDDYEVYGFLVDKDGEHTEILYGRGLDQAWTTNAGVIPEDGEYQFRFVAGSFNRTDGTSHGATLSIDNIRILSGKVVGSLAEQIGQLVTYETTELLGDRNVNITVTNGVGETSEATTVPISMDTELDRSLTIEVPGEGELVYNPTPTIKGEVLDGSNVSVTLTSPSGYSYTDDATVADGTWTLNIPEELYNGGDTITVIATASHPDYPNTVEESTFVFVDKSDLEEYINVTIPDVVEDEEKYNKGWPEYQKALKDAEAVLDEIEDNPGVTTQDDIDTALKNLKDAVAALEKHPPIETDPASYEHGDNKIIIDFNKNVKLTNTATPQAGFIVTVDGIDYLVTDAVANDDKVTLTVDQSLDSDAEEVRVSYTPDETNPNLFGDEPNGAADEAFDIVAKDEFGAALQITTTKGNTDKQTPEFTGTAHIDADQVTLTFYDNDGNEVEGLIDVVTELNTGTWTYTIPADQALDYGKYTFKATATGNDTGRTVTKSAEFIAVDKTALEDAVESGEALNKDDHRAGWDEFANELAEAKDVLDNPTASQGEVNTALEALQVARDALEKHPPIAEKATFEHGDNEVTIEYDKDVVFEDGDLDVTAGFTVTMDGKELDVVGVVTVGNKVVLILADGTELSSDADVEIVYNEENSQSNLVGDEENGTPTKDATFKATDEFGAGLQIEGTKGNTDNRTPPFYGDNHADADRVTLTIVDSDGTEHVADVVASIINAEDWIFEDWAGLDELTPGDYTVYATAKDDDTGRTVTKSTTFTVVDKTALEAAVESGEVLEEDDHRAGWDEFAEKLAEAIEVLNNSTASQEEVNTALDELQGARDALEKHPPIAINATFDHGFKEIIVVFDKNAKFAEDQLDLTGGFTVTVDDIEVNVIAAELVVANGEGKTNKVKLTLEDGTELSSDAIVQVIYNEVDGSSNLFGDEENGTAVEDFTFQAGDPFGHALQIDRPGGITNDLTPIIEGTADAEADYATITIIGPDGEKIIVDADDLTINPDGTWTYNVSEKLSPGEYKVEVTTSQADRPDVTKDHYFTVVDKTDLIETDDDIIRERLEEDEYTKDSWTTFEKTLKKANEVIANPESTQVEVDVALDELEKAYLALVYKVDLAKEVAISNELDPSHYSKDSWNDYEKALENANGILHNPASTQEEINAAEKALKEARAALTVDKSLLEAEEEKSAGLSKDDYKKASWSAYQKALDEARAILSDPNTTQAEVDATLTALEDARAALEAEVVEVVESEELPKTATNIYHLLIFGTALLVLGLLIISIKRRRNTVE